MSADETATLLLSVKSRSALLINGTSIKFMFAAEKPNWWWRLMHYVLLGWRWEDV